MGNDRRLLEVGFDREARIFTCRCRIFEVEVFIRVELRCVC